MSAADFIAKFEGCAKIGGDGLVYPYLDAVGVPTIGYGHVVPDMRYGPITQLEALNILMADLGYFQGEALRLSPTLEDNPDRLTAITSFCFNLGVHAYENSTLRKRVDAGDWAAAQTEIVKWNHAGGKVLAGLTLRREAEAQLLKGTP